MTQKSRILDLQQRCVQMSKAQTSLNELHRVLVKCMKLGLLDSESISLQKLEQSCFSFQIAIAENGLIIVLTVECDASMYVLTCIPLKVHLHSISDVILCLERMRCSIATQSNVRV